MQTFALLAAAAVALAPAVASASQVFPAEVQKHLGLSYTPCCTLCHVGVPGLATVQNGTPFGMAVLLEGVGASQLGQLDAALDALEKAGTDSDGDHTPDIEELTKGTNPNGSGPLSHNDTPDIPTACDSLVPVYGCGASSPGAEQTPMSAEVASGSSTPSLLAIATGLLLFAAARRRRR